MLVSFRIDFNEKFREQSVPHVKKASPLPEQVRWRCCSFVLLLHSFILQRL